MTPTDVTTLVVPLWAAITGIGTLMGMVVAAVVWFVRLEAKVLYLEKGAEQQELKTKEKEAMMWSKIDAIQVTLTSVLQSLSKIEGKLEANP